MNKIFMLMCVLCFIPLAVAMDSGYVNETTRIWSDVIAGDTFYDATNATLDVYNSDGAGVELNINMTKFATGIYYYDFVPNQTGNFYTTVSIQNATSTVGVGSETLFVQEAEGGNAYDALVEYFGSATMWENFILIGVFTLLYVVGFYVGSEVLIFGAALVAFGSTTQFTLFTSATFNALFFVLIGLATIYHGIFILLQKRKKSDA